MALTLDECREYLFQPLNSEFNVIHVILTADPVVIKARIENDEGRDIQFAYSRLLSGLSFLQKHFQDVIWIDTTSTPITEVVDQIIKLYSSVTSQE